MSQTTTTDYPDDIRVIGDKIAGLTCAEAQELNEYLKYTYGIEPPAKPTQYLPEKEEEVEPDKPDSFKVVLQSYGDNKVSVIKVIRQITGLALKAARDFVNEVPQVVKEDLSKPDAEALKEQLEVAGGVVTLE